MEAYRKNIVYNKMIMWLTKVWKILWYNPVSLIEDLWCSQKTTWGERFEKVLSYAVRSKTRKWHMFNTPNTLCVLCFLHLCYTSRGTLVLHHPINFATNRYNIAHTDRCWSLLTTRISSNLQIKLQYVNNLSKFIRL